MQNVTRLVTSQLRCEQLRLHHTLVWSGRTAALTVGQVDQLLRTPSTDVNKYLTHIIPIQAFGHRSTVTFRFNLYRSSAIRSPSQPTSLNAGLCLHFSPTARCLTRIVAGLLLLPSISHPPSVLPWNQSGRTCLSTATSDWGLEPLKRPPRSHLHYRSTHCNGSQFSCGTCFRNKELYLYSIVFVVFVFPADCALSLPVGYCNYWRIKHK